MMYSHHSYTPNHHQYELDSNNRPISFPRSLRQDNYCRSDIDATKVSGVDKEDRRTSFGFPTISAGLSYMIPTPECRTSSEKSADDDSPPIVQPPPNSDKQTGSTIYEERTDNSNKHPSLAESNSSSNPLQESRCMNLLSKKFEPEAQKIATATAASNQVNRKSTEPPKRPPTVQDASLLLGLSTDTSNTSSPATVPEMRDETESACNRSSILGEHSNTGQLPNTCFPAKVPKNYPKRLSLPNDSVKLNALHCFIRTELLEIFVVEPSKESMKFRHAPSSSVGRVGLRCVHCTMARRRSMNASRDDEAPMAVFYPKSVSEIYRLVTSWQRCHVRKCKSLPPPVRAIWNNLRETEKSRGKTAYWVDSAKEVGLVDCPSRAGGIRFEIPDGEDNSVHEDENVCKANTENDKPAAVPAANV